MSEGAMLLLLQRMQLSLRLLRTAAVIKKVILLLLLLLLLRGLFERFKFAHFYLLRMRVVYPALLFILLIPSGQQHRRRRCQGW